VGPFFDGHHLGSNAARSSVFSVTCSFEKHQAESSQVDEVPTAQWSELRYGLLANWRTTMGKRHKPEEIIASYVRSKL
jgi:hypothetical protein